ncbi:MAG: sugar transferase [Firmicutes bacterium]|nr:sugar transferase [Bacillota bacterium]
MKGRNKMLAPIALFAYKRLDHLKRTLDALSNNHLAPESELFIFCDAADNADDRKRVSEVRVYIQEFSRNCVFKAVHIENAHERKGLSNSIILGLTMLFNEFGKAIVVEDDIVTTPDFLNFMNDSLDYYKDNKMIWSINGCTLPLKSLNDYPYDVYLNNRANCWGWASWKDRWELIDWKFSDYKEFIKAKSKREIGKSGSDLIKLLNLQMEGRIDSWDTIWSIHQIKEGMYSISPRESYVINIGLDGSGEHCTGDFYKIALKEHEKKYSLIVPELSHKLMKEQWKLRHRPLYKRAINKLLRILLE